MAKEAKARHAVLYPNYKYSPSHRSVSGSKRKPRRDCEEEKAKCDMIASFLQKGVEGSALGRAMSNVKSEDENKVVPTPILLPSVPMMIPSALSASQSPERRRRKEPAVRPRVTRTTTAQHRITGSNLVSMKDRSLPVPSTSRYAEADSVPTLEQFSGTPELLYPLEFVPIDDIPPLSLDGVCDMKVCNS